TLFVEARNTATVGGQPVVWPATYVVTLRDDLVVRARAYYDRSELLGHFEPDLAAKGPNAHVTVLEGSSPHGSSAADGDAYAAQVYAAIVAPYAENGKHPDPQKFREFYAPDARMINPGFERPLRRDGLSGYYAALTTAIRDFQLHLECWAVAPELLFIEWTVTGELAGKRLELANTDRFTLRDLLAVEGVAYFDNLAARALTEPKLARFADVSFANRSSSDGR
ncbi:MAG: nuclear transport factor 2 family protein, partial [Candidatus Binataceae bacterium]